MSLSERLAALKQQKESEKKTFPLWALLHLYETGNHNQLYLDSFAGFKLLVDWLGPIEIPVAPSSLIVPRLHQSFELQQIASILKTNYREVYYSYEHSIKNGYKTKGIVLFQSPSASLLPPQVPTQENECPRN